MNSVEEILEETEALEQVSNGSEQDGSALDVSSFNSSNTDESTGNSTSTSIFAALYKARTSMTQEKRREKLLEEIKLRRHNLVDAKRELSEILDENEDDDVDGMAVEALSSEAQAEPESMEVEVYHRPRRRRFRNKRNKLMLSEWFIEIPSDLESEWLAKLCPVGQRNLVVANNKITKAYDQRGRCVCVFPSDLPGGSPRSTHYGLHTVMDCIFNREKQCFIVLDILAWRGSRKMRSLLADPSEVRFFWLKSKLDETPELKQRNDFNKYPFFEAKSFAAELPLIEDQLSRPYTVNDEVVPLDGVLFYHRLTPYIEKANPLVGWLKPYMVPEMLQLPVNDCFMKMKPEDYTSLQQHIKSEKDRMQARRRQRHKKAKPMEEEGLMPEISTEME